MGTTFQAAAEGWLAEVRLQKRPSTVQGYEIAVRKLLAFRPELAGRPATRADLIAFAAERAKVSMATADRDTRALKTCLNWAWGVGGTDHPRFDLRRLILQPNPPKRDRTLSPEQIGRLMEAASIDLPVQVILRICRATGFRLGEVLHLAWADVNFENGTLSVTEKVDFQAKTNHSYRTVKARGVVDWLAGYRRTLRFRDHHHPVCQMDPFLGKPWTDQVHARIREVFRRAGVPGRQKTHALRHTVATDLAEFGVPVHAAQAQLGHARPDITIGIYTHVRKGTLEAAGDALEEGRRRRGDAA